MSDINITRDQVKDKVCVGCDNDIATWVNKCDIDDVRCGDCLSELNSRDQKDFVKIDTLPFKERDIEAEVFAEEIAAAQYDADSAAETE